MTYAPEGASVQVRTKQDIDTRIMRACQYLPNRGLTGAMSLPYFPMYPSDFEAKTSHLTLEEDGAYNRLLRLMWMTPGCSLPDSDAWIMRRMRCDADTFERVVLVVIDEFCERENGRVSNAKLTRVFNDSAEKHSKRVLAGSFGGKAKALQTNKKTSSNAVAKPYQPEPEPEPYKEKRDTKVSPKKRAARLPENWVLSKACGEWAVGEGYSIEAIRIEAEKFKDYWIGVGGTKGTKLDWPATWRNWIRNSKQGTHNGNGNINSKRRDPALEQIARLTGLSATPGDGGL